MDRNATTGMLLITLLFFAWYYFFAPKFSEDTTPSPVTSTESQETIPGEISPRVDQELATLSADSVDRDSQQVVRHRELYSDFYDLVEGKESFTEVKTEELTLLISNKGGRIVEARLNRHLTYDSLPLPLIIRDPQNEFGLLFEYKGRKINSQELFFTPSAEEMTVAAGDSGKVVFTAALSNGKSIEQIYNFKGSGFGVGYQIRFNGFENDLKNSFYEIVWTSHLPQTELSMSNMRQKTTIAYAQAGDVEKLGYTDDPESEKLTSGIDWVSYKSQFFSAALIGTQPFRSAQIDMYTPPNESSVRVMNADLYVDLQRGATSEQHFTWYLGPNEYSKLRSFDVNLEKQMDLGWWIVSYINIGTVYIFKFLEKYISSYGLIIIIFAFLIKVGLFPLTFKNYISMAKLRVLNQTPEMKALDEKHKDEPQKLQMAKMGIYREMGVNMFGGCLPMLLQYPFLIAMFFFFPQSVELRQKSFLWAHDLSTYDSIVNLPFEIPFYGDHVSLFTILMAISIFVYTYFSQKSQPTGANPQFKYIAYMMPVIFLVFLNNYASGLSLYYFTSNLISIAQTTIIRYTIDDEKLLAQMRATQKSGKGKKTKKSKGGLENWLEKQQKKQQDMLKQRQQGPQNTRRSRRKNG